MFLRCYQRIKNGKRHQYYSIVENRRIAKGQVTQKTVLYLGEITRSQEKAWRKTLDVFDADQNKPVHRYLFAAEEGSICQDIDAIPVRLSHMKLSNPRAFGDCWLGCKIWDELQLDSFWEKRIDQYKTAIPFSKVLKLLVMNRLICTSVWIRSCPTKMNYVNTLKNAGRPCLIDYDVLLYDLTSTYFEELCEQNPKAQFGHSKDRIYVW